MLPEPRNHRTINLINAPRLPAFYGSYVNKPREPSKYNKRFLDLYVKKLSGINYGGRSFNFFQLLTLNGSQENQPRNKKSRAIHSVCSIFFVTFFITKIFYGFNNFSEQC